MERELTAGGVRAEEADHFTSSIGPGLLRDAPQRGWRASDPTNQAGHEHTYHAPDHRITGSPDHRITGMNQHANVIHAVFTRGCTTVFFVTSIKDRASVHSKAAVL
jgi:hypothetical protein